MWEIGKRLIEKIEEAGFEAVFVGGAVRDFLLGRPNHDVDIATSALPLEIKGIFQHTIDVGIEHGTVLVLDEGEPIEITTYRTDGQYTDFRRPDEVMFVRSLAEDLARRDFTINAMAMTKDGVIIDLFGGQADLQKRLLRAVGKKEERFAEDALRMLRAVRFSAQLGFTIEEETLYAVQQAAPQITRIAKERIHQEMKKIWISDFVQQGIAMLIETNMAHFLQGHFCADDWREVKIENDLVGWAYLNILSPDENVLSFYKCSNKEKLFAKQVANAYEELLQCATVWTYFNYERDVLKGALQIAHWRGSLLTLTTEQLLFQKEQLSIQTPHDLAINGRHLISWTGQRGGPWVKEVLDRALEAVLLRQIKNDEGHLKRWFHNVYQR